MTFATHAARLLGGGAALLAVLPACELVSGLGDLEVDSAFGGGGQGASSGGAGGVGGSGAGGSNTGGGGAGGTGALGGGGAGGMCTPGALGEPCCMDACQAGAACDAGTCVTCGALGEPCCNEVQVCDAGLSCGAGDVCQGCVASLHAGSQHHCVTLTDNTVWCWGINIDANLGQPPSPGPHPNPTQIDALSDETAVLDITSSDCVIKKNGTLWCWGENFYGELGNGTVFNDQPTPTEVTTLGNAVTAVGTMGGHTCAFSAGKTYCWGDNGDGELALNLGDALDHPLPEEVTALTDTMVAYVGSGAHTCALTDMGAVWCWGDSQSGRLGFPLVPDNASYAPDHPLGLDTGVTAIAQQHHHGCAIKTDKTLWCWGNNFFGQLGDPTFLDQMRSTPTQVIALGTEVEDVSTGDDHTCALKTDGTVWCWGGNGEAQLGQGSLSFFKNPTPVQVVLPALTQDIEVGAINACALLVDGRVYCWGRNLFGQSGVGADPMLNPNEIPFACP